MAPLCTLTMRPSRLPPHSRYLESLHGYLVDFVVRAQPLQDLDAVVAPKVAAFEGQWQAGTVRGWEPEANDEKDEQQRRLFCVACTPKLQRAGVRVPSLAHAHAQGTHVCTHTPPGGKEFAKQTVFDAHLPGKKHKVRSSSQAEGGKGV